ncbi:MAG: CoA-acylating methylmalonate-semialdehyde dehydrogenase [Candidatus Eremiobacteraeota bacterium]|nr:CoA-acylating methylmalonate-semialdehyde dehydrogenase [Candidatus Eremiobacteraeota bacterium]
MIETHARTTLGHFIGGVTVAGLPEKSGLVYDPATGDITKQVAFATRDDLNSAVEAAKMAFRSWSQKPPLQRVAVLFRFRELIVQQCERLAAIITAEHGKTLGDAAGEVQRGLEVVEFACGIPHLLKGEFTENAGTDVDTHSMRQPLGVCAGISPFNFPAMVPMWMFPIAIACGNTFIMKPSEKDPSLCLELAALLHVAGLPAGVFNVVNGDKTVVDGLLEHEDVSAVSFVGSTPVAQYVYHKATQGEKRVQALGGAKNHLVVMPEANFEQAADALMGAAYGSAGERCMAISLAVTVGDQTAEALINHLKPKIAALRIGSGSAANVDMGPLITPEHREKVCDYIELAQAEGARVIVDGREHPASKKPGFFLGATLLDGVTEEMRVYKEEIFGPVLGIVRARDFESAIGIVNGHEYGNGSAIFTGDGNTARTFAARVQTGMVGINVPIPVPVAAHSFGGWKHSLFGDHAMHGLEGARFYTRLKTVTSRWPGNARKGAEYAIPATS